MKEEYDFSQSTKNPYIRRIPSSSSSIKKMVTTIIQPSSLIHEIRLEPVDNWYLFKFSETLQLRMESLLDKKKADQLTLDEIAELSAISEIDRIFTHMNAMLAAQYANQ